MIYITAIIGFIIGAVLIYILLNKRMASLRIELEKKNTELELARQQAAKDAEAGLRQLDDLRKSYESQLERQKDLQKEQMMQQQQNFDQQLLQQHEQFVSQLKSAQQGMEIAAQKILEQNSEKLKAANIENVGNITTPLKEAISDMRKALDDNSKDAAKDNASFREVIRQMMESSKEIGEKAESLTNVLRRDNKVSGNMGEIILGDLLKSQGLIEGVHYDVQPRIRDEKTGKSIKNDETGSEMQPDVILHYPQGQDAIIDSKVSMVAYERYVNAESEEEKAQALKDHTDSVRRHVNELARKDYSKYVKSPREAVDFVIMFMPFESSLQLALANDTHLWRDAFEKKVFITSEQNLVAILHMIHVAWVQNQQAENQKKVFGLAEQLLDRLGDFIKRYRDLGDKIKKVDEAFDYTGNKLFLGKQSVVQKGRELVDLGAKENPNRKIPEPETGLLEDK